MAGTTKERPGVIDRIRTRLTPEAQKPPLRPGSLGEMVDLINNKGVRGIISVETSSTTPNTPEDSVSEHVTHYRFSLPSGRMVAFDESHGLFPFDYEADEIRDLITSVNRMIWIGDQTGRLAMVTHGVVGNEERPDHESEAHINHMEEHALREGISPFPLPEGLR